MIAVTNSDELWGQLLCRWHTFNAVNNPYKENYATRSRI